MRPVTGLRGPSAAPGRLFASRALALGLAALVLVGCAAQPRLAGAVREPPLVVDSVRLPDASAGGRLVGMTAAPGELLVVYFGYTSCPDICPTTLSDISVALGDLPEDLGRRVTVALVTVDPERDTDERLVGYLGFFFDRAMALRTTDPVALSEAARAFGVGFQVEEHQPGTSDYDVAHTAITYVVDSSGTVLVEWPFGFPAESMTSDLEILLTRDES